MGILNVIQVKIRCNLMNKWLIDEISYLSQM